MSLSLIARCPPLGQHFLDESGLALAGLRGLLRGRSHRRSFVRLFHKRRARNIQKTLLKQGAPTEARG
jgi:hypothetical protein